MRRPATTPAPTAPPADDQPTGRHRVRPGTVERIINYFPGLLAKVRDGLPAGERDAALLALKPCFPELAFHFSTQSCVTSRADVEAARRCADRARRRF